MDLSTIKAPDDPPKRRTTRSNSKLNNNATKVIATNKKNAPTNSKAAPKKKKQQVKVTRRTSTTKLINSPSSSSRTSSARTKAAPPKVSRKPPPKTLKSATIQSKLQKQETLLQSSVKSDYNARDKVAKSIKSKVAKQHKYASGDVVAAAKEAKLAANKSSIKAALLQSKKPAASKSSKESFASKLKKQGGQFERGALGRGELVKKSVVDGNNTSSSKYTRRTTYGSGKRSSVRGGGKESSRFMKEQYDDPLDVAYAQQQRSSSYQDSVGSTKAAAAKKKPAGSTAKAAAKKKQPPINHVKKSRGAKSSTSGGCSLTNVGCDKAVDKKVAAKTSSTTTTSTKSTTSAASTTESTSSSSPSAIEKNLSRLRMAAKNAAKSAAAKSTKSTSASKSNSKSEASSTQKGPWQCDFCFTAKFDSYNEEAKKHEECCEARSIVEIHQKEEDKKLGLVPFNFVDKAKTPPTKQVVFAKNSPVFKFSNNTRAATNSLFGLDAWSTQSLPDDIVEAMVQLGKLNLPQDVIKVDAKNAPTQMSDINNEVLKAALVGHIRPGDSVRKILYSEGSKKFSLKDRTELRFDHAKPEVGDLNYVLKLERYYPLQLTLRRNLDSLSANHNAHLSINPLIDLKKLDLNKNRLVGCDLYWDGFSNGLHLLTNLKELKLDDNNIGKTGCKALVTLLKKKRFPLKKLSLRQNSIDDECIFILTKALQKNKTLTTLDLYNNNITAVGWDYVSDLLCNKSGIEATHTSNHTLKSFGVADWSAAGSSPSPTEPASITALLTMNKTAPSKARAAKEKVWKTFFKANNDTFDMQPLLEESVKIMPHILAYFAMRSSYPSEEIRFRKLYHILRNWNVPALFDNSSPESERLGEKISALGEKNASLELLVKRLQAEKSQLKQENKVVVDELKGEIQGLKKEREEMEEVSDPRKSKKRRVSPNK